jgi:hypothetical protein
MRRTPTRRGLLALGGTVLGSGCLRLTGGGSADSTTERDADPNEGKTADAETESGSSEDEMDDDGALANGPLDDFPPGVDEDAVHESLAATHDSILKRTSFTMEWVTDPNTNLERRVFAVEGGRTSITVDSPQFEKTTESFVTPERTYRKVVYEGQTLYQVSDEPLSWADQSSGKYTIRTHIEAGAYRPTETVERDGTPYLRLEADEFAEPTAILNVNDPEDVSAYRGQMLVREDGVVVEFQSTIEYAGNRNTRRTVIEISDIGETSVSAPSWTEQAASREPTFEATMADDRSYIALEHVGGDAVRAPIRIACYEGGTGTNLRSRIESGISKGETLYFTLDTENSKLARHSEPPTKVDQQFAEYVEMEVSAGVHLTTIEIRSSD